MQQGAILPTTPHSSGHHSVRQELDPNAVSAARQALGTAAGFQGPTVAHHQVGCDVAETRLREVRKPDG